MNVYYKIWVDGIIKIRSIPSNKSLWKFYSMLFITMAMAMNLALVITILEKNVLKSSFYELPVDIFSESKLNSFVSFFILFFLPPLALNYLLIFRNNRYERLIEKYEAHNGKLCASYLMISYFLPFFLIFLVALFD